MDLLSIMALNCWRLNFIWVPCGPAIMYLFHQPLLISGVFIEQEEVPVPQWKPLKESRKGIEMTRLDDWHRLQGLYRDFTTITRLRFIWCGGCWLCFGFLTNFSSADCATAAPGFRHKALIRCYLIGLQ